jgi:hypothetical protein
VIFVLADEVEFSTDDIIHCLRTGIVDLRFGERPMVEQWFLVEWSLPVPS